MRGPAAVVVGAGVTGLTTGVCLAEAGFDVEVVTAEAPLATTSAAAGAMWGPYLVEPRDRVRSWSLATLQVLRRLAAEPTTGVRIARGIEASRTPVAVPDWADMVDDLTECDSGDLPGGFAVGWRFSAPLVDMPTYLTYLVGRLEAAGGRIRANRVESLADLARKVPVVVNCSGLGARRLVPDYDVEPIRGQLVVVENPGITEFFTEDTGWSPELCHIYPHDDTVVLGGVAQPGSWDLEPDQATASRILARCRQIEPRLERARVIGHRVGLRPTAPEVRLRAEEINGALLVHNYGHGGAGVTLSWGCAMESCALAAAA